MVTSTGCPHSYTYTDIDEIRCRACNRSLTFPQRAATTDDEKELKTERAFRWSVQQRGFEPVEDEVPKLIVGSASCLGCHHQQLLPRPNASGKSSCTKCGVTVALECSCCHQLLPDSGFYKNVTQVNREGLMRKCKRCQSSAAKVKRDADPEPSRTRSREYARILRAERAAGTRATAYSTMTPAQVQRQRVSTIRSRARKAGQLIPLQQVGGRTKYGPLKPVCRIRSGCPLAQFCR